MLVGDVHRSGIDAELFNLVSCCRQNALGELSLVFIVTGVFGRPRHPLASHGHAVERETSVTVMIVALLPSCLASDRPCSTPLCARSGPSVGIRIWLRALADNGLTILLSTHEPAQAFAIADHVIVFGPDKRLKTGPVNQVLTSDCLSRLYGIPLAVEATPSGRRVVTADLAHSPVQGRKTRPPPRS